MQRIALIVLAVCLFVLPACAPSPAELKAQAGAAATTAAAGWTATPDPTDTPRPTATATTRPSATPQPTATFTASPRPSPAATRTPADGRYVEETGYFSYIPPIGWLIGEISGLPYRVAYTSPIDGFSPNLTFVDEANADLLADYVTANIALLDKVASEVEIISQEAFTPTRRLPAVKLIVENVQADTRLRQTFYFFEGWSRKVVAIYTRPAAAGERNDSLVDVSMESFQLIQREQATAVPTTSGVGLDCPEPCADATVFTFAFPFEPSSPGYLIEIRSEVFSADVMCALDDDGTGRALDLDDPDWVYGTCDTTSLTLDGVLTNEVTVTVILGGFPIVDAVTQGPRSVTDYSSNRNCSSAHCVVVEYDFTAGAGGGPTG